MRKLLIGVGLVVLALLASSAMAAHGDNIPDFTYNPGNGQMFVNTDTLDGGTYEGLYSMLIPGPEATTVVPTKAGGARVGLTEGPGKSVAWQSGNWYQDYFNSKEQWVNDSGLYLNTSGADLLIATYGTGLTASSFGQVEYRTYRRCRNTHYTSVSVVPEPGTLVLLAVAGVAVAVARRRRAARKGKVARLVAIFVFGGWHGHAGVAM